MIKNPEKVSFSYRDNLWGGSDLLATGIASFGHASGIHYQNLLSGRITLGLYWSGMNCLSGERSDRPKIKNSFER